MKRLEVLLGRSEPAHPPDLDGVLRLRDGAGLLAAAAGMRPTGDGALALRPARADRFVQMFAAVTDLVARRTAGGTAELRALDEGSSNAYQWVTARGDRLEDVVAAVHALASGLHERGFGAHVLAAAFAFVNPDGDEVLIVYLFGRGTFYPLGRSGDPRRDRAIELGVRGATASTLPPEDDRAHRLAVAEVPLP